MIFFLCAKNRCVSRVHIYKYKHCDLTCSLCTANEKQRSWLYLALLDLQLEMYTSGSFLTMFLKSQCVCRIDESPPLFHQGPTAEGQPFRDHYRLQDVLHSGTTPSLTCSGLRYLAFHKLKAERETAPKCKLFCHAESPGVSVLMLCAVVRQRSAADVWQGLAVWRRGVCFVERKKKVHNHPWRSQQRFSCERASLRWENSCVWQQRPHQMGSCSKGACKHVQFIFVCSRKKRKHWQT